jgi:hypothetical protein
VDLGHPLSPYCRSSDWEGLFDPLPRARLKEALAKDNTTVRLGPDVDLNFSNVPPDGNPLLSFGRCVTLTSVSAFTGGGAAGVTEARTPRSLGPVLRYGKHRDGAETFLEVRCYPDGAANDGARISGFRLFGPDFGNQSTDEVGIRIVRCVDIEISNMEIAGWGGDAISIEDEPGPDQSSETNGPGGRIMNPDQVRIHDNFLHHNQHPSSGGHAEGYGVNVHHGAWARISNNVFDFNRHAIATAGDTGGYAAELNLVLKGGGRHGTFFNPYTHIFDVHGTGCGCSPHLCGDAGIQFWYHANAFQYRKDHAIKIRGKPALRAYIDENIFPHPGLASDTLIRCVDRGNDAIKLDTWANVEIGPGNDINFDSFGRYGVCDFDGDRVDDLFLATGATWWFSSAGEFHWSYLNAKKERLDQVRLGYFDDDLRCDVLADHDGQWEISSGGTGDWKPLGRFDVPLSEVQFGRFDPSQRDHRPGATRRTTHAFWRKPTDRQWRVTPLSSPDWKPVQSSRFPMKQLRFGDFTGDGVTDVLAVENGRWAISESATGTWRRLNSRLGNAVENLIIANMDPNDNIDDILRLERQIKRTQIGSLSRVRTTFTWWRSKNGTEPWRKWKDYVFEFIDSREVVLPTFGFAGRFGAAPGGGTLVIDQNRLGHFYSEAEIAAGAAPDWTSLFPY